MQKFSDTYTSIDLSTGDIKPTAGVQVFIYQGNSNNLATLYKDDETTKIANPLISDSLGFVECKLANGTYDVTAAIPGASPKTVRGLCAFDGNQSAITITMPPQFVVTGGINVAWAKAPASKFLRGPVAGAADAVPTFDSIKSDDLPVATPNARGAMLLAASGDVKSGTATDKAIPPSALAAALGFTGTFLSLDQTITGTGDQTLVIPHGLGKRPVLVQFELQCVTAELGYSVGDIVDIVPQNPTGSNAVGFVCLVDATNVSIVVWNGPLCLLINKTNHSGYGAITNANWKIRVRAFA